MSNKKHTNEFPDILHFLDISRTLIRQIEILQDSNLPPEQKEFTREAIKRLTNSAQKFMEVDRNHGRAM